MTFDPVGIPLEQARRILQQAARPEGPRPLCREPEPATAFPIEDLGSHLRPAAEAIQERTQAPIAMCGQAVLAATAQVVQGQANVTLPTGNPRPVSEFFVTVAESGQRKSEVDTHATAPIVARERALTETYRADLASYQIDRETYAQGRSTTLAAAKKEVSREQLGRDLENLGPEPTEPRRPALLLDEPTLEGMHKLLTFGQPSIGLFSTEGARTLRGHGMNPENRLRMAAGLSHLWDGAPIRRTRAGDGHTILYDRRLSLHLMLQPKIASELFADSDLTDQGLLSRILIAAPDSNAGQRLWRAASPEGAACLESYKARLLEIMERPFPLAEDGEGLALPGVPLSREAAHLWIAFHDAVEGQLGPNGQLNPIKSLGNKMPEHAARLAAVIAMIEDVDRVEIPDHHMAAGIALAKYYAGEALRLHGAAQINAELVKAGQLKDWLLASWKPNHGELVSLPDIYQRGPSQIRDQRTARRAVDILDDHGWLAKLEIGAQVNGVYRQDAWRIMEG